jgi:hypothetical protein
MQKLLVSLVVSTFGVASANAGIIATAGNFQVFAPATANYTASPYNDAAPAPTHIWVEQTGITLLLPVVLDTDLANPALQYVIGGPGVGQVAFAPGGGPVVAAGTRVDVYYSYFDPAGTRGGLGSVTFDTPVLGIIAYTERLPISDFLRVPGAPYPGVPAFNARGWEETEWGQLSADRRTLTFNALASNPGDQFRIITAAVPEPASCLLVGLGVAAMAARRRTRRDSARR